MRIKSVRGRVRNSGIILNAGKFNYIEHGLVSFIRRKDGVRSPMANSEKVKDFYLWDYDNTLFPMETCRLLIERNHAELAKYIVNISDSSKKDYVFLPQETVYASKPRHHLRRTMKLDPVAEYFLYDLTYKNL